MTSGRREEFMAKTDFPSFTMANFNVWLDAEVQVTSLLPKAQKILDSNNGISIEIAAWTC